jgi:putative phosphoribosyl transferase
MKTTDIVALNRENAGILLAGKLTEFAHTNTVVVGVPHGGVCVAAEIADKIHCPLEVMMCRKIKDPSNESKTIGSVSASEVLLHDCEHTIPQDYLYLQAIRMRNEIKYENDFYYGDKSNLDLEYKTVILVDDILLSADTLMACIQEIRKRRALRIIVAVPFVETEAARIVQGEADEAVFLKMQQHIHSPNEYYQEFADVDEWKVRQLLHRGKSNLPPLNASIQRHEPI